MGEKHSPPKATIIIEKTSTLKTEAKIWEITHNSGEITYNLHIAKFEYKSNPKAQTLMQLAPVANPNKSISLENEAFIKLLNFFDTECGFLNRGTRFPDLKNPNSKAANFIKKLFEVEHKDVLALIENNQINPSDLLAGWQLREKEKAILEYENMLNTGKTKDGEKAFERHWQAWFENNTWALGSNYIKILDERRINEEYIADFLAAYVDGFVDVIELKLPEAQFWHEGLNLKNYVPFSDLIKAITQVTRYVFELEKKTKKEDFTDRVGAASLKPKSLVIYGRSNNWNKEQNEAFRLLNASYHNITILTFDHILARAKRLLETLKTKQQ